MNQTFATQQDISTSTQQEINSEWQKVRPFVNYQNHKPDDPILPSNYIFLNHIDEHQKCCSHITGLGSQSAIEREGLVQWTVVDQEGQKQQLE
eukprot:2169669-Ditylum_brightwellii.AAC.1